VDSDSDHRPADRHAGDVLAAWARLPARGCRNLIREEFGLRTTFIMMAVLVLANLTNVMANFAGIAGSLELFHISRYISVPLGGAGSVAPDRQGKL